MRVFRGQDHGRATGRGLFALGILQPDFAIDQVVAALGVFLRDLAARYYLRSGLIHPAILHAEFAQPSELAGEIGHQVSEERVLQRAVQDYAGEAVAEREVLVVVDLIEVAGRAGVPDELLGGRIFFERSDLGADLDVFKLILLSHRCCPFR